MSAAQFVARAVVRVVVEVKVPGTWGEDCPLGQVERQAAVAAREALRKAFSVAPAGAGSIKIVDEPLVTAVLTTAATE